MGLKTQLSREIEATEYDYINRQYDEHAKRILATRKILAYILQRVVDELEGMTIDEIVEAIEGDVEISSIPLLPDSIIGQSLEDSVYREGKIFFDLRFTVRKIDDQVKILFDLEAQKDYDPGYPLVTRGIVYAARMISRQIDTEFKIPHYEQLKKVYSIWVCFEPPKEVGNAISRFTLQKEDILNSVPVDKKDYDKISVIQICIDSNAPEYGDRMIHLLNTLFSGKNTAEQIEMILEDEYDIPKTYDLGKEVSAMCNLSEMIEERGIEKGIEKMVMNALRKCSPEQVSEMLDVPIDQVKEIEKEMLVH